MTPFSSMTNIPSLIVLNTVSQVLDHYFALAVDPSTPMYVRMTMIERIEKYAKDGSAIRIPKGSTYFTMKYRVYKDEPEDLMKVNKEKMHAGSPIGSCGHFH